MAGRIRTIKPERLDSVTLGRCSDAAFRVSEALILLADDYGNGRVSPELLKARVWMYRTDVTEGQAWDAFTELVRAGYAVLYEHGPQQYFHLSKWATHQRIEKPGNAIVPGPNGELRRSSRSPYSGTTGDHPGPVQPEEDPPANIPEPTRNTAESQAKAVKAIPEPPLSRQCPDTATPDLDLDLDLDLDHDQEGISDAPGLAREASAPLESTCTIAAAAAADLHSVKPGGREVWESYLAGWRRNGSQGPEPKLTDARRKEIRARLKEHDAATVIAAVKGIWLSKWNVDHDATGIDVAMKSAASVERFAAIALPRSRRVERVRRAEPVDDKPATTLEDTQAQARAAIAKIGLGAQRRAGA